LYGAETWTLRKVDQKCLESFEMRCCTRMEISWTVTWEMKKCQKESRRRAISYIK